MLTTLPSRLAEPSYKNGYASSASASASPALWRGLVSAWCPSLGPTGNTLFDAAGVNNGTLTNMEPETDWVVGEKGVSLELGGTDEYADCGEVAFLDGAEHATLFTVFDRADDANKNAVGTYVSSAYRFCIQWSGNDNVYFVCSGNSSAYKYLTITDADFHSFAQVYDGTKSLPADRLDVYVDGLVQSTTDSGTIHSTLAASPGTFKIGKTNFVGAGQVATTLLYNRPLLPYEIQHLHLDPLAPFRLRARPIVTPAEAPGVGIPVAMHYYTKLIGTN